MDLTISNIYISAENPKSSSVNYDNINTDVVVLLNNGRKYTASFFSYSNIEELKEAHKKKGSYLNGKYFWDKNMVLVENCSRQIVSEVVKNLLEEGDFKTAFRML